RHSEGTEAAKRITRPDAVTQCSQSWSLRVIAQGAACASPIIRAHGAKGEWYEKLQCIGESDHVSYPAHRVRHCSRRGVHSRTAAAGPRRRCYTATRALQH